jgi:hypothetical protein
VGKIVTLIKFVIASLKDHRELLEAVGHLLDINERLKLDEHFRNILLSIEWSKLVEQFPNILMLIERYFN